MKTRDKTSIDVKCLFVRRLSITEFTKQEAREYHNSNPFTKNTFIKSIIFVMGQHVYLEISFLKNLSLLLAVTRHSILFI